MTETTLHLVFKTHLDIGFTDHAEKVRRQYHERFIPQAIDTAEHFLQENSADPAFVWTTGAWLIWDHLDSQPADKVARLERAIGRGLIRWHALPFTTHSELMSPALFRAGLSYAAELDRRFGVKTIAAKMTDVPGHPRGIVPLLAEAGVKFLHLGVNAASPVPVVPDVFRWQAPGGEEIVVMYESSYGATRFPEGFTDGLGFAHTNDNMGPQSVPQVAEAYRAMRHAHPGARIRAATLDDYGQLLWDRREEFPVIDIELGDSWIHGVASDPQKLQRYLALQRLHDEFAAGGVSPSRLAFGRRLALVAEHTWGVDIKSYLRDEASWDRPAFAAARQSDFRFAYTEASWAEQRGYIDAALGALEGADLAAAQQLLAATAVPPAPTLAESVKTATIAGWQVAIDPRTGDVVSITSPAGLALNGRQRTLFGFRHDSYDAADVARFRKSYITQDFEWALLDFGKPGLENARTARSACWQPALRGTALTSAGLVIGLDLPEVAKADLGAPAGVEMVLKPLDASRLEVALVLRGKPANRMPEAGFLLVTPAEAGDWDYRKMGLWQRGDRTAANGGGHLQAVAAIRSTLFGGATLQIEPLDTPLVGPAGDDFMHFPGAPPDLSDGVRFNLYNNKWGTNFVMWWEGDLLARYLVTLTASAA